MTLRTARPAPAPPAATPGLRVAARAAAGFTLIEILVVVTIIAILAALVAPKVIGRTDDAKRARVLTELRTIEAALAMYKLDNGTYPSTEQGLEALVQKPTVGEIPPNWREGGYLSKVPVDPWGQKYVYAYPGTRGEYDLYSLGADRQPGGEGIRADIFPDSQ